MQSDLSGDTEKALQLCQETMKEYQTALIVDDLLDADWWKFMSVKRDTPMLSRHISRSPFWKKVPIAAEATAKIADIYRWHLNKPGKAQETYTTLIQGLS